MMIRDLWDSMIIACSMYSRIPMPRLEWTAKQMKYVLGFFPLVGVVIGVVMSGWACLASHYELPVLTFVCIAMVIPLLITGGIHMDGYLDTVDARSSHLSRERKLEILADPHTGAFALIGGACYLLISAGLWGMAELTEVAAYSGCYVWSRAMSAMAVIVFPKAKDDGLAKSFSADADKRLVMVMSIIWLLGAISWVYLSLDVLHVMRGVIVTGVMWSWYYHVAVHEFGGTTGDLAGWFLQLCELLLLAAMVI